MVVSRKGVWWSLGKVYGGLYRKGVAMVVSRKGVWWSLGKVYGGL